MDQLTGVYTTLAEYTSREARYNLVLACLDYLAEEAKRSNVAATMALAERLHVSQRSIQRWAQGGIQSCNVNAEAIIYAAIMWIPEKAAEILAKDLEEHRRQLLDTLPFGALDDTPMSPENGEPDSGIPQLSDDHVVYSYVVTNKATEESKQLDLTVGDCISRYGAVKTPTQMFVKDSACRKGLFSWGDYTKLSGKKLDLTQEPAMEEVAA